MYGLDSRLRGNDDRAQDAIDFMLCSFRKVLTLGVIPAQAGI